MIIVKEIILTLLMSAVPVIELRGGIPYGIASGLEWWEAYPAAVIGNLLPVPFIMLGVRWAFSWLRKLSPWFEHLISKMEEKAAKNSKMIEKYELLGLFILVAIPLPGTGAWTGALVAAMLEMRIKHTFPVIALGVLVAGAVVTLASLGLVAAIG